MKVAVLSDIHSNYHAFYACYQDALACNAQYFIFLAMKKLQLNPEMSTICFRTPLDHEQQMSLYRYFKSVDNI